MPARLSPCRSNALTLCSLVLLLQWSHQAGNLNAAMQEKTTHSILQRESCWTMYLSEGAQRLQPPGHSAGKALLSAERGEHQAVLRAVRLIGPVCAPKLLNGLVRTPGELVRQVHPLPLVDKAPVGHRSIFGDTLSIPS